MISLVQITESSKFSEVSVAAAGESPRSSSQHCCFDSLLIIFIVVVVCVYLELAPSSKLIVVI